MWKSLRFIMKLFYFSHGLSSRRALVGGLLVSAPHPLVVEPFQLLFPRSHQGAGVHFTGLGCKLPPLGGILAIHPIIFAVEVSFHRD